MSEPAPPQNPYVGPQSFRAEDEQRFFGRDRETRELFSLIVAERVVLMHSPSGAGKTSLLQAALIPRLGRAEFSVRPVIRVNTAPGVPGANRYALSALLSLEKELPVAEQIPETELAGLSLSDYLQRRPPADAGAGDVLIFDQFEEVLTLDPTDVDAKVAFFTQLGEALREQRGRPRRWALFAMREEFMGALAPYVRLVPTQFINTYRLGLLGLDGARQAIQRPAAQAGVTIANDAAQHLVRDLARVVVQRAADGAPEARDGLSVEPVQLQVVCTRLWEESLGAGGQGGRGAGGQGGSDLQRNRPLSPSERSERVPGSASAASGPLPPAASAASGPLPAASGPLQRSITLADVQRIGDVSTALADYYGLKVGQVAAQGGVAERAIREWFSEQLITPQGIRGQVLQGAEESQAVAPAIRDLQNAYLVRAEPRQGRTWFELAHDRLIDPVRSSNLAWFEANLSDLQREAKLWDRSGRPDGLLFLGDALRHAEAWAVTHPDLRKAEQEFLDESRKAQLAIDEREAQLERERAQARRIRNLAIVAGVVSVIATVAFIGALVFRNQAVANEQKANENARIAQENAQIAQANEQRANENARIAQENQLRAEQSARESRARELAASALSVIGTDPELSVKLGIAALAVTEANGERVVEAEDVLQQSIQISRIRERISLDYIADHILFVGQAGLLAIGGQSPEVRVIERASGSTAFTLPGHEQNLLQMAYSPASDQIATLDGAGTVRLWDGGTGAPLAATFVHTQAIALDISADGARLATGGADNTARIWTIADGQVLTIPHSRGIERLAFSPDGALLGTVVRDRELRVWDAATGEARGSFGGAPGTLIALAFSPNGRLVAASGQGGVILIWRLDNSAPALQLRGHTSTVYSLAFSSDSQLLVSSSADGTARIWDAATATSLLSLGLHRDQVRQAIISGDGLTVVTTSRDRDVRLWSLGLWQPSLALTVAADAQNIALSGGVGGTLYAWGAGGASVRRLREHTGDVNGAVFSPDGTLAASGGSDGKLVVWDVPAFTATQTLTVEAGISINEVAISPDNRWVAAGAARTNEGWVVIWDRSVSPPRRQDLGGPLDGRVNSVAFSPDGRYVAVSTFFEQVLVWEVGGDTAPRFQLGPAEGQGQPIVLRDLAFHPTEGYLAFARDDGTIQFWRPETGERWAIDPAHSGAILALEFNADGSRLVSTSRDNTIRLWDTASRALLATYSQPATSFEAVFQPGSDLLLAAGADGIIRQIPMSLDGLRALAGQRVTRPFSALECAKYRIEQGCAAP